MRRTPFSIALGIVLAATVGHANLVHAVCELPLVIGTASGNANVLIILDTSQSMNEIMMHSAYNPSTNYSGNFDRGTVYSVSSDGNRTPRSFKSSWPNTPSAYLVNSDGGWDGDYPGNYLNWVYFHATSAQRSAIPTVTRMQMAKQAVNTVFTTVTSASFGLMVFNGGNGGTLAAPIGTSIATLQAAVNATEGDSYTPLAETLVDALDYYKTTGAGAPIASACQKSFVIMVTDGMPTFDVDVPAYLRDYDGDGQDPGNCTSLGTGYPNTFQCSGYVDDVATYMYRNDLRDDLDGIQNVAVFTIGVNINAPLLQATADKGGGEYYTVSDLSGLSNALTSAFIAIDARISAGASVSVVSAEDRTDNRLFRARYESLSWKGFVESFSLPYHSGDAALWESGSLLAARASSTRKIFTSTTGTNKVELLTANATLQGLLGAANLTAAQNIINFTRGDSVAGSRSRMGWKLGDVVDAAPVMVGKPSAYHPYLGYSSFRSSNASRNEVLYVAANDGMMHCFDASDGSELWGYVPKNQLGKLGNLMSTSYCHEYFVNLTPTVSDVYMNGAWRTVLFGGQERGGTGLFALDVTSPDPDAFTVLWDINMPSLLGSWSSPTVVRDATRNAFVLCVGTGYSAASAQANLFVMNPADGSILNTIALGSPIAGNKTTEAVSIDKDFDGYDDLMYLGDLAGRLWRVDMRTDPWTTTLLFDAGRPIQSAPVVTVDAQYRPMVFFGTGQYLTTSDPYTTSQQGIYGIIDDGSGATVTLSSLVNQTSTIGAIATNKRGWYIELPSTGERVTKTPALVAGTIYMPSFRPDAAACTGGAQSYLYTLDYQDGSAPDHANGAENNTTTGRSQSMGDGILADPSVDLVNEDILLQSSNAVLIKQDISVGLRKLMVRSWRQKLE